MSDESEPVFIDLEAGSEWRFELEADENIAIKVQSPDPVYINSEEIPPSTWYPLYRHLKGAVYAPDSARIEVSSLPASQYTSNSTSQSALISVHLALERLRILARRHNSSLPTNGSHNAESSTAPHTSNLQRGPRVMVVGPPCSGKTTVVKNLVNMATSTGLGWTPGVISLDPSSPSNLIPGSLSISTPSHTVPTHHLAHPLGSSPTSVAANTLGADVATVGWWYGHTEPTNKGSDVWKKLTAAMGAKWSERCAKDPIAMASGVFVDTPSAFTNPLLGKRKDNPKAKYTLVADAIENFQLDTIIVIGHEKLTIDLTRIFPSIQIVRIPRSSGTVDLDDAYRQIVQAVQIRAYFYGEPALPPELSHLDGSMVAREGGLSPYSFQIGWETLTILRVGEENAAPSTALPLGSARILSPTRLTKVDPSGPAHITRLLNSVLAIVHISPEDRLKPTTATPAPEVKAETEASVATSEAAGGEGAKVEVDGEVKKEGGESGEGVKEEQADDQDPPAGDAEGEEEDGDEDEVPYREEIGWGEILGFIVITGIDTQRKKYTVLSPSPGKLPSTVAIAGSIEWVDSE